MRWKAVRWVSAASAITLMLGVGTPARSAAPGAPFGDWVPGSTAMVLPGGSPALDGSELDSPALSGPDIVTAPLRADGVTTRNGPVSFTRSPSPPAGEVSVTGLAPGTSPAPTAVNTGASAGGPSSVTSWCYYWWSSWTGAPRPPGSGGSYGIARASGLGDSWTQAFESHDGILPSDDTSTAYTQHNLPIYLGDWWPQPSRLIGVVNPSFKGQMFLDSNNSIFGNPSSASSQERIRYGWNYNGRDYYDTLFDIQHSLRNGTEQIYTHRWGGNPQDGEFAYIDGVPDRVFTFRFRVDASVTTVTEFGAGARSQLDWGSRGIDAPRLGPNNNVRADHRVDWALIGYEVPNGWTIYC